MSLLGEALCASLQPCSYSLLILALVVLGLRPPKTRLPTGGVYYVSVTLFAWVPFWGVAPLLDSRLFGTIGLAAGLLLAGWPTRDQKPGRPNWWGWAGVFLVGAFAGATWLPCVGAELGSVLTAASRDPWSGLLGMALYLLGVMWPVFALAVLSDLVPGIRRAMESRRTINVTRVAALLLVLIVALDIYPDLLSRFAQLSTL